MQHTFYTLDVFTDTALCGNPLAVVLDADSLSDHLMQKVAREFNLSETVFVCKPNDPGNTARIRIFMPRGELPFAGHPTIGTALLLDHLGQSTSSQQVLLEEQVGLVIVDITQAHGSRSATLNAAVMPFCAGNPPDRKLLAAAAGLFPEDIGFDNHQPGLYNAGVPYLFVPVRNLASLERCRPTEPAWSRMTALAGTDGAGFYTRGAGRFDWQFRLFAPESGIPEDPATGSAAAALPGQLMDAEGLQDGTHSWQIAQGVEMGSPSEIHLEANLDNGRFTSVRVGGSAVIVSQGAITI